MQYKRLHLLFLILSVGLFTVSLIRIRDILGLKEVIGKDVNLSCISERWPNGKYETVWQDGSDVLRLMYYIDSTKCFGCQLKWLDNLKRFYALEKKYKGMISVDVIVSPAEVAIPEIEHLLTLYTPEGHPVYYDEKHQFLNDNSFLKKRETFHMFLIDKDRKIICTGNAITGNNRLADLYEKRIIEYLSSYLRNNSHEANTRNTQ